MTARPGLPLRVLNVMLGTGGGGLERSVASYHAALIAGGAEVVSVLTPGAWAKRLIKPGWRLLEPETSSWGWLASRQFAAAVDDLRFDVVVTHGNRALRAAASLRRRAPIVAVAHATNLNLLKEAGSFDAAIIPSWTPEMDVRSLDPATLAGQYAQGFAKAGLSDRAIALLPHGLDVANWPDAPPAGHIVPVVGALGRFHQNKGFDILLNAARQLKDRGRRICVVIAGADETGRVETLGALRDALGLNETEAALPGWVDKPADFLASLDVFCLPSRKETFGLALLEAMAAGRPIVASALPDLRGAFGDGREGLLVAPDDASSLAAALERLCADDVVRKAMGERARRRAQEFDFNSIGARYVDTLSRLAKRVAQ